MKDTRTKIIDVAADLVQRFGLNGMSYKHISDAVGIRKASIHYHFPKKDNLIDAMLENCHVSYGSRYQAIVEGTAAPPEKLRRLAGVFLEGLQNQKLCLVATIGCDRNSLQASSCKILEKTIQRTVNIFAVVFRQGREDGSLLFAGTIEDTAYAFFAFLLGAQISARAQGCVESFSRATEAIVSCWEN